MERLQNAGVNRRNDIYSTVQVVLRDTRFPCVRKAAFDSRLAVTHKGHGEAEKHFLALAQAGYRVRVSIKLAEIRAFTHGLLPGYSGSGS